MRSPAATLTCWPYHEPFCESRGSRNTTAPGRPATSTANRLSCACTRSRTKGIWLRWSFASVSRNCIRSSSMNSRGVQVKTSTPFMAAAGVGQQHVAGLALRRRPEAHAGERRGFDAERGPARGGLLVEQPVGLVEPQQILALDVEDQHAQVGGALAQDLRMRREHAQEEQRERGLGGDTADAADRHVAALASVEEVEVDVHRELVAADPHGQRPAHLVDVERLVAFVALGALDRFARVGRDPHLGVDARDGDARGAHLRGRHDAEFGDAVGVGLVAGALVDGLGLGDDAVRADLAGLRHLGAHHDQVVQLEEVVFVEHHAEGAGVGVLRTEDPADLALVGHEASCSIPGFLVP